MSTPERFNKFFIGMRDGKLTPAVVTIPWPLSPDDALLLAAWLVAMAEPFSNTLFADVLKDVKDE